MVHHTGQNRFAGSTGNRHAPVKGGAVYVEPHHTIGAFPCWCQGDICWIDPVTGRQDWDGRQEGRPHPRSPFSSLNEESAVSGTVQKFEHLNRKDVKKFGKAVGDLLIHIVNDLGVAYRLIDGNNILLYPPDGHSRPFKANANRPAKNQADYLHKFIAEYDLEPTPKEQPVTPPTAAAFVKTPPPQGVPVAPQVSFTAKAKPKPEPEAEKPEWWNHTVDDWETNGTDFRCLLCKKEGIEWTTDSPRSLGGHKRAKHGDLHLHRGTHEAAVKGHETRRANAAKEKARRAILDLIEVHGIEVGDPGKVKALEADLAACKTRHVALAAERDAAIKRAEDAEAKIALMKEAFSGLD